MYREVKWAVPADPYILQELSKYDGWHTAKNLEINTEFSRQWISQRLSHLCRAQPCWAAFRRTSLSDYGLGYSGSWWRDRSRKFRHRL